MQRRGGYQTKQKVQILGYLEAHAQSHLTAAELVLALAERGTPIGAATVYRTLERLEAEGLVRRYMLDDRGGACWQYAGGQNAMHACHSHFHLKCVECGALLHVDCEYLQGIGEHILAHHGFTVDHSRTVLYGLCEHCRAKSEPLPRERMSDSVKDSQCIRRYTALGGAAAMLLSCGTLAACGEPSDDGKLSVVTTVYATYDLTRQLLQHMEMPYEVKLLLTPGGESHAYEPTPADAAAIQACDLFVYIGGESEQWADKLITSTGRGADTSGNLRLMDCVTPVYEDRLTGLEENEDARHSATHDNAAELAYDEHIWTSPENALHITTAIADALEAISPDAQTAVQSARETLTADLIALAGEYEAVATNAKGDTLVFADRFPFRYLTDAYRWKYYAAFSGCSSDTDASAATLSTLISKVQAEGIDTVFYLENSSRKIADAICDATGAKAVQLQSCNNVSREDFDADKHYQDFMRENLTAIEEALG